MLALRVLICVMIPLPFLWYGKRQLLHGDPHLGTLCLIAGFGLIIVDIVAVATN